MRQLCLLALAVPLLAAAPAMARTPSQEAFHTAFKRMDKHWPNVAAHDYWLALRDAQDLAKSLSPDERTSDKEVADDLRMFPVYQRCWTALTLKEKALSEFVVGQLIMHDTGDGEAAREHFAMAVAAWDEAFRIWPYLAKEPVRGDGLDNKGEVVRAAATGPGYAWRSLAQRLGDNAAASR